MPGGAGLGALAGAVLARPFSGLRAKHGRSGSRSYYLDLRTPSPRGTPPRQIVVILCPDSEVGDLVAERVAMHAERLRRAAEVTSVGLQRSDDELSLELSPCLLESQSATHQLVDDLIQT